MVEYVDTIEAGLIELLPEQAVYLANAEHLSLNLNNCMPLAARFANHTGRSLH